MKLRLLSLETNSLVRYTTREGFVNLFPITFEVYPDSKVQVLVGFSLKQDTVDYQIKLHNGVYVVEFFEDLKEGLDVTIRRVTPAGRVPHTYHYTGNAKGSSEFNQKTMDENFEYLSRITGEIADYNQVSADMLEDAFGDASDLVGVATEARDTANEAMKVANEAKDIAEGTDAKATEALDNSQEASDTAQTALDTANSRATEEYVDTALEPVFLKSNIAQEWGDSPDKVVSQKTVTELIYRYRSVLEFEGATLYDKFLNASESDGYIVPLGNFEITVIDHSIIDIIKNLRACLGSLTIKVEGHIVISERIHFNCEGASNISIVGNRRQVSASGVTSITGEPKKYSVTLTLSDASTCEVGDVLKLFPSASKTQDVRIAGGWLVTNVEGNNVTVLNTSHTEPKADFSGNCHILKSSLKVVGDDCIYISKGSPFINDIALIGDYNLLTGSGTKGTHGIAINSPKITEGNSSNMHVLQEGGVRGYVGLAILNFGEQGFTSESGNSSLNFVSVTGCRKRGIYSTGAYVRCKFAMCVGNGEDGFISDFGGASLDASLSISAGNGFNGYWATNSGYISAPNTVSRGNLRWGYEARGLARIGAGGAVADNNVLGGGLTDRAGSFLYAPDILVRDSPTGLKTNAGGSIYATGAGFTRVEKGADVVNSFYSIIGNTIYSNQPSTVSYGSYGANISSTSLGWLRVNDSLNIVNGGHIHPVKDNIDLGRSNNVFRDLYLQNQPTVTSDANAKLDIEGIDEKYIRVISRLKFKQFKLKTGTSGRTHFGIIAQEWIEACRVEGVDPYESGVLVGDAKTGYAIRYNELQILHNAYVLWRLDSIGG